jgi:hypothetical protein
MKFHKHKVLTSTAIIFLIAIGGAGAAYSCSSPAQKINKETVPVDTNSVKQTIKLDQNELEEASFPQISANFVDRLMNDLPVNKHLEIFKNADADSLDNALDTPRKRLTFWINIYNGYTQHFLKTDPSLYQKDRGAFFGKKQIPIAGYTVSMEDIEHGILRRGATIWSKGYIRIRAFRKDFIQKFVVNTVDFRIHFSLNCGAKSCPPVVAYQEQLVGRQLDDNSKYYLGKEVAYDTNDNIVRAPVLMNWFSADFGGSDKEKLQILKEYDIIPKNADPKLKYLSYDWTMMVENYKSY